MAVTFSFLLGNRPGSPRGETPALRVLSWASGDILHRQLRLGLGMILGWGRNVFGDSVS